MKYKDIVDRDIQEGDIVAVGQRSGNGGSLGVAIVLDIIDDQEKIRILGSGRNWNTNKFVANSRYGDTYPERLVVVNESVPKDLAVVLREAYVKYWGKINGNN